jgi:NodT family efflux transporter outer membrane factor (OMF) lipoprotein
MPLLSGCASTAGIATRAQPIEANGLAANNTLSDAKLSPAAWPRSDWWKQLNDPQLDQLIDEALIGSPTLRVAESRARKALALAQGSNAALYPQVNANAQLTRERFPDHALIPPPFAAQIETQAQLGATVNYDLDLWGGNRAAYASALGQARAAEVDAFAARLALSVNIAQAYVQLARASMQRDVAEQTLRQREQIYKLTRDRFDAGLDSQLAVKQTESALPATRELIAQLDESIGLTRNQISALLGKGPDRGLSIARPQASVLVVAELPSNLPADLVGRRPDVVAQRWRVEATHQDIDVAKAQFYPNINLAAFIGFQSIGLPDFLQSRTAGIGPAISLPIFDGGRLRGNLAGKSADYDATVESYNQTVVDALRDVADQITVIRSIDEQRKQQQLALATTQSAYDLAAQRFREGIGNYLEVLTAESQLLAQQSLDVDLRARALGVSINLNRALGGGYQPAVAPLAAN